jgi:ABC-type sugar transport system substrate-binding protein
VKCCIDAPFPEPLARGAQSGSGAGAIRRFIRTMRKELEVTRSRISLTACVGAAALLVAVWSGGAAAKPQSARYAQSVIKLGVITKFPVGFYTTLQDGAKKFDKQTPAAQVVFAQGKSATDDAGEIAAIQDMVTSGVKGIAIAPTSAAVVPALKAAQKRGVKVVLIDNDIPAWKGKASVVATNNFNGGKLAGKYIAARLKPGDKIGILAGVPGVPSLDDRVNGMLAGLGALKSQLKIVGKLETDCDQTKGFNQAQTLLTANPDLKAIYSACGPPAVGADQALTNAHVEPSSFVMVGFDAQPDEVKLIVAGRENASVAQFPYNIGYLGAKTLWAVVQGKKVARNIDTGTALVLKSNAKKYGG